MSSVPHLDPRSVTIIIPQYNQPELTIQAIESLRLVDPIRWPILVADNGSSPESLRQLHGLGDPDTEVLALPRQGLTAAWNAAVSRSRTANLVFLNNDTLSRGPWVAELLAPVSQGLVGMAGVERRREAHLTPAIDLLSGWCFAVCRETFYAVHGFDEALSLYFSDTDFQLRVREQGAGSSRAAWVAIPGLPVLHLSHRTAHRLPDQRACWNADHARFQARWQKRR